MARPIKTTLTLWMNGEWVGRWRVDSRHDHEFRYAESWLTSAGMRPISLSMPLRPARLPYRGPVVRDFFENLLPDNDAIRRRIQARFGAASIDAFDLLTEIGRDCVGAIQLLPENATPSDPQSIQGLPLSESDLERYLAGALAAPLGQAVDDDFRISIAGAQEKTAFLFHRGRWMAPRGSTPTTHIFKLPIGKREAHGIDLSTSVENEWLCHKVLTAYGIPVASCEMATFGAQRTLIVQRFDRKASSDGTWILRLPQEDMCQALGQGPARKYERDGGPGIRAIMELLLGSVESQTDRQDFFRTQIAFWLLCAIDGHAKNFSLFIEPQGRYRLAPRYDVLSAYPVLGSGVGKLSRHQIKMAMAIWDKNRHYKWLEMRPRHWAATARDCGLKQETIAECLGSLVERTPRVIEEVNAQLPAGFPDEIATPILEGILAASAVLSGG